MAAAATAAPAGARPWQEDIQQRDDISAFRRAALHLCALVPRGRVTTYKLLAEATALAAGSSKPSARAAGNAMRGNPYAPIVPCHRVVASNLTLGGFSGSKDPDGPSLSRKEKLLREEGVPVASRKVAAGAVYEFSEDDIEQARTAAEQHKAFLQARRPGGTKRSRGVAPVARAVRPRVAAGTPAALRAACQAGAFVGQTAGQCPGYAQANLVIVPGARADDFEEFCRKNGRPCPLLERLPDSDPRSRTMAPGADVREALPRYRVWKAGSMAEETTSASSAWAAMASPVAFLLGCSFSFEEALARAGLPVRHVEEGCNVPMFVTSVETKRAGPFHGPMVVSMRPMTPEQAERAKEVTARFSRVHGAPVHVGDPSVLGIDDLTKPDFGDPVPIRGGEVPVFWACGVTPQLALQRARLPLAITHSPGHMLVLDRRNADLADDADAATPAPAADA